MDDKFSERAFSTRAVWSGTNNLEGSAITPIFTTSTFVWMIPGIEIGPMGASTP